MSKRKFLIPLAAFSLLFSSLVACGGKGGEKSQSTSKPADNSTSQPAGNSTTSNGGGASTSQGGNSTTSQQQAHEHDYELVAGSTAKNADGKDVYVKECKDHDDKYIGIAFDDYSEKSADFGDTSGYTRVPEELRNESHLLAKSSTISWKINIDKAISGAKIAFGAVYTGSDHGTQLLDGKYTAKVNDGEAKAWEVASDLTYDGAGLSQTARAYVTVLTADLVAGENTITLGQGNGGYRLLFGGEVRVHFSGDAKPVTPEVPFEGYNVTFTTEHCKVLVYEGKKYDQAPVETNTTKAMDEDGNIVAYDPEDELPQPQVNFKVVPDDGYSVNATNITVTGKYKNLKQNPAKTETPAVDDESIFRITKVQEDLTVAIVAVQGQQAKGYKVTFVPTNCQIKVYVGPKNEAGDNLDTPEDGVYYARLKDSPYDIGFTTPQMNFEVVCENGYEFVPEIVDDKASFIAGSYNKAKVNSDGTINITKVASDLTITIAATQAQAPAELPVGSYHGMVKMADGSMNSTDLYLESNKMSLYVGSAFLVDNVSNFTWDGINKKLSTEQSSAGYGVVLAYNEGVFTLESISDTSIAALFDSSYPVQLSGNCQFIDCGAMTLDQMNATFVRRYDRNDGNGWQINNPSDGRISVATKEGRTGLQCNGFSTGKVGFTLKNDLPTPIPGSVIKSVGCWIYNPGETSFSMSVFAYKSANRATNGQLNTFTIEPGWHFYQSGVVNGSSFKETDSFYNFQFYYANVSVNPVFDDLCIYM